MVDLGRFMGLRASGIRQQPCGQSIPKDPVIGIFVSQKPKQNPCCFPRDHGLFQTQE